ncbi:hypothetical protein OHA03_40445 [Streptomyces sp. NBC_00154]|nr:hypothetical protein [Streptomyces sp. NBC_00154]
MKRIAAGTVLAGTAAVMVLMGTGTASAAEVEENTYCNPVIFTYCQEW